MVQRAVDPLTGAARADVLISREDAERLGVTDGEPIRLVSATGRYSGRARIDEIKPGNVEVHWPEGNVLLSREERDAVSREPDYNTFVRIERL
jgi:anaerobic selenocysteine-containing dehydrogenase